MKKNLLSLIIFLSLSMVTFGVSAFDGSTPINWEVSGTIANVQFAIPLGHHVQIECVKDIGKLVHGQVKRRTSTVYVVLAFHWVDSGGAGWFGLAVTWVGLPDPAPITARWVSEGPRKQRRRP